MIMILAIVFVVLLAVVGGDRGIVSLISLAGNILVLMAAVIAMMMRINPILVTLAAGIVVNCITILYQNGKNAKSASALLAVAGVMAVLLLFVLWIGTRMQLDGLHEVDLQSDITIYYSFNIRVNMHLVCISMIIIGVLGALMDSAVAVSSAVYEVYGHNPQLTVKELFQSGINVGKDILTTTLNTLYFAYIGEALLLLLYLRAYKYSLVSVLNSKAFLQEFTCIMISAIGCVLVIPLSAWITAKMLKEWTLD